MAGGLVSAVTPGLRARGGLWVGTSGEVAEIPGQLMRSSAGVTYLTTDITPAEQAGYYDGFANATLWPLLHGLESRSTVHPGDYETFRAVARRLATVVRRHLTPADLVWVHDYQLLPVGEELRRMGWDGPLGYFLHVPVPETEGWGRIPYAPALRQALRAYDLIGVQTPGDAQRMAAILGGGPHVASYPVTIDAAAFRDLGRGAPVLLPERAPDSQLIVGVDRLDYTKAIPQRLEAYERLLERRFDLRERTHLVQWAVASRSGVAEYRRERAAVDAAAARINWRWGLHVIISHRNHPRREVAAALAAADIGLVTPAIDGMNLVAKEFAAVHDAEHPGVLVLSRQCGAAPELPEAIFVTGGDPDSISEGLERALDLSLPERRAHAQALRERVDSRSAQEWFEAFVSDLEVAARRDRLASARSARTGRQPWASPRPLTHSLAGAPPEPGCPQPRRRRRLLPPDGERRAGPRRLTAYTPGLLRQQEDSLTGADRASSGANGGAPLVGLVTARRMHRRPVSGA